VPTVIEGIGQFAAELSFGDLDPATLDYAKRILLDSLACVVGGLDSEPARIARSMVDEDFGAGDQAYVYGTGTRCAAPLGALANGVALRYQDYNDVYFGPAWTAHPSDNIATLLAVADWRKCTGRDFLVAMVVAYEVQMRFSDLPVRRNLWHGGWHHTGACAYSAAAGVGKLLGLDSTRLAHAIALSGARANTLSEIRHGHIPMDKALSAPIVASQSIVYALLAQRGFTGCSTLLEGKYGFGAAVAGGVDVTPLVPKAGDFRTLKVGLKPYPVEGMTPAMVQAALELKQEYGIAPGEVQRIRIFAHNEALTKPSWDDSKLAPTTKETADHSFYYCVAVALVAGEVTSRQFTDEWLRNADVSALMGKTTLEEDPEFTRLFRQGQRPAAVEVMTARGVFRRDVLHPLGDPRNPMTWSHVTRKFKTEAGSVISDNTVREIIDRTFSIENEKNMRAFAELLAGPPEKRRGGL
jgi:2-methylcitrate dehydratase